MCYSTHAHVTACSCSSAVSMFHSQGPQVKSLSCATAPPSASQLAYVCSRYPGSLLLIEHVLIILVAQIQTASATPPGPIHLHTDLEIAYVLLRSGSKVTRRRITSCEIQIGGSLLSRRHHGHERLLLRREQLQTKRRKGHAAMRSTARALKQTQERSIGQARHSVHIWRTQLGKVSAYSVCA